MIFRSLLTLWRLRKDQWLGRRELEEIQQGKLRRLIAHAYQNVLYYRRLFDEMGVKPDEIRSAEDLARIPITTKAVLQSLPISEITARRLDLGRCVCSTTSGTQGRPLTIYYRKQDQALLDAVWARAKLANGQRLTDRVFSIKESTYPPSSKSWFQHLGIWRRSYALTSQDAARQLELLQEANPHVITGYPSSLKLLGAAFRKEATESMRPRLIFTTAELLDSASRREISSAFGGELFDYYGANETGLIAWECPQKNGYHINIDSVIVEFLWDGKAVASGREGKLVCTALHSYAMPFIRYEIGDVGVWNDLPCPCGRGLPLMKVMEGRFVDFILLKNGTRISPFEFTCAVEDVPGIGRYQIVQEEVERLVIRLEKTQSFTPEAFSTISRKLQPLLGDGVKIEFEVLDHIPRESQKYRVVISRVAER